MFQENYSVTPTLQPIVPAVRLSLLDDAGRLRLRLAALEILDEVGIHCPSPLALEIYAAHGARVDFERQVVVDDVIKFG